MSLEFEKLTQELENMAGATVRRRELRNERRAEMLTAIRRYGDDWAAIDQALVMASQKADEKHYRAARPFSDNEKMDTAVSPPSPPVTATIIATDGSQIMPDRHAAHLYYLINVGGIIYHHGQSRQPDVFSIPEIVYPDNEEAFADFQASTEKVSIERDLTEINTLAEQAWAQRYEERPLLTILDQRLLYWPTGATGVADNKAVYQWGKAMSKMHDAGALLAGYIDRPGTMSVLTLLRALTAVDNPDFDWKTLGKRAYSQGLTDRDLFTELLQAGQRSAVFTNISQPNNNFREQDPGNEVCFFYLNAGLTPGQIARVDIPLWVAEDHTAVGNVHALIIDQCRILGDYPYVLARADEMAVVGRRDAAELNFMIDIVMQRHGISDGITAKQGSKELARGGRTRHEGV